MRQIILSTIMAVACILRVNAQQDSLALQLLSLEQKAFFCVNDTEKNSFLVQKVNAYIAAGKTSGEALSEVKRVDPSLIKDSLDRLSFFWNAAIISHLNHDYNSANNYVTRFLEIKNDTAVNEALFAALIYNEYDTAKVSAFIAHAARADSAVTCFSCLNKVVAYNKRGKNLFVLSSYLLPGSGSIMLGHVLKGAVSLLIFSGIGAGVYLLVTEGLYLNAAFFAMPWLGKFYGGQIRLTKKLFDEKELKKKGKMATRCGEKINKVLMKYPLDFRR